MNETKESVSRVSSVEVPYAELPATLDRLKAEGATGMLVSVYGHAGRPEFARASIVYTEKTSGL